ncbi:unnamed protein product [Paramecium octaurelia]|uniref:Uncharacterized protein n=1 Tax=Paramecium octaurelia TaxID=43137 RepID=A0A8S1SXG1_PAROT|nr:unnamed protein product [Paramecium octaurelia]
MGIDKIGCLIIVVIKMNNFNYFELLMLNSAVEQEDINFKILLT